MDLDESLLEPWDDGSGSRGAGTPTHTVISGTAARRLSCWLLTLAIVYGLQRASCFVGIPDDCVAKMDSYEFVTDFTMLVVLGSGIAWFDGIHTAHRYDWLFSRERWYFGIVLVFSPIVYSLISDVPWLKHDFDDIPNWGIGYTMLFCSVLASVLGAIGLHVVWAIKESSAASYLAPRLLLLGSCAASLLFLSWTGHTLHVHHLYLGLGMAMWADTNHPVSATLLTIGTAIFIQGLGAYSYEPITLPLGCFDTASASEIECVFTSGGTDFSLRICPAAGRSIMHTCKT